MNDDDLIGQVFHKIEREKALINAANAMRQSSNPQVQSSLDAQIREGRKNISYLEERMRELQIRQMGQGGDGMPTGAGNAGSGPMPPAHGNPALQLQDPRGNMASGPNQSRGGYPPEKGGYGDTGQGGYMDQLGAGQGVMPSKPPYGPSAPGSAIPKVRPNYSKLGKALSFIEVYREVLTIYDRPY